MRNPTLALMSVAAFGLLAAGCGNQSAQAKASQSPKDFLKWSMDQYHQAKSFSATLDYKVSSDIFPVNARNSRTIAFQAPNLFRVAATMLPTKVQIIAVSDGMNETDYSDDIKAKAMTMVAPGDLNDISTRSPMNEPTIAGSEIYNFFGGSGDIGELQQQGGEAATWGPDGTAPNGEPTKTVRFLSVGLYGNTEATIGTKTGLVYKLTHDMLPVVQKKLLNGNTPQQAIDQLKQAVVDLHPGAAKTRDEKIIAEGPSAFDLNAVETFENPTFDAPIQPAVFKPNVPAGEKFVPPPPDGKAPVAVGSKAPDFTVRDASGNAVRLSSLRGHVVLIDFWATWCAPCREGLPVTAAIAKKFAKKGLKVLAVSYEPQKTISDFVKQQTYHLPAFCDANRSAMTAYHIDPLPTTVIVDAKGNLTDYITGLAQPGDILNALATAGLNVGS